MVPRLLAMRGPRRFPGPLRSWRSRALFVVAGALLWQAWSPAWPAEPETAPPDLPPGQSEASGPEEGAPEPVPLPVPPPDAEPEPEPVPEPEPLPGAEPQPGSPPEAPPARPGSGGAEGGVVSRPKVASPGSGRAGAAGPRKSGATSCLAALSELGATRLDLGPPNSTARLVGILAPLEGTGVSLGEALRRVAGPFPVAGEATWSNDWHAARCNPTPHPHKGIDIFAEAGTPLVAASDGRITQRGVGAVSGLHVEITDEGGVQYFYAHLSGFAPGLEYGQRVEMGDVIGYVGTTGNARGTSPHVHLELQPNGTPIPPKLFIDRWLEIAERKAVRWARSVRAKVVEAPHLQRGKPGVEAAGLVTLPDRILDRGPLAGRR
jgi:hypothetical protein